MNRERVYQGTQVLCVTQNNSQPSAQIRSKPPTLNCGLGIRLIVVHRKPEHGRNNTET